MASRKSYRKESSWRLARSLSSTPSSAPLASMSLGNRDSRSLGEAASTFVTNGKIDRLPISQSQYRTSRTTSVCTRISPPRRASMLTTLRSIHGSERTSFTRIRASEYRAHHRLCDQTLTQSSNRRLQSCGTIPSSPFRFHQTCRHVPSTYRVERKMPVLVEGRLVSRLSYRSQSSSDTLTRSTIGREDGPALVHPGSRVHWFHALMSPRWEDWTWTSGGQNRFAYLGNGFSTMEAKGRDKSWYFGDPELLYKSILY
jgi:hypothetical protein